MVIRPFLSQIKLHPTYLLHFDKKYSSIVLKYPLFFMGQIQRIKVSSFDSAVELQNVYLGKRIDDLKRFLDDLAGLKILGPSAD